MRIAKGTILGMLGIGLVALPLFDLLINGPRQLHAVLLASLSIFLLISKPIQKWGFMSFSCFLLLLTAYPLARSVVTTDSLLFLTGTRQYFHRPDWLLTALILVLSQASVFAIFSWRDRSGMGKILDTTVVANGKKALMAAVLIVVFSILSNPTLTILSGGYGGDEYRSDYFLFGGWPLLFIAAQSYFIAVTGLKGVIERLFVLCVVLFWLLHGNRSEVLSLAIILSASIFYVRGQSVGNFRQSVKSPVAFLARFVSISTIFLGILILFAAIGSLRVEGVGEQGAAARVLDSGIPTVGPSAYTLAVSVGLIESGEVEYAWGKTYLDYLLRSLPSSVPTPWVRPPDLALVMQDRAQAIGGLHFAGEPFLNFGPFGPFLIALIFALVLEGVALRSSVSQFAKVSLVSVFLYLPRIMWYGNIYLYKLMLLLLSVLALMAFFNRTRKIRFRHGKNGG